MAHTIAAVATAKANAGISVIRISGDNAVEIAGKVFLKTPLNVEKEMLVNKKVDLRKSFKEYWILLIQFNKIY